MILSKASARSEDVPQESRRRFEVSANLLCVIGAVLGVSTFLMPWIWTEWGIAQSEWLFLEVLPNSCTMSGWRVALVVFMIGTILAFASPMASFIQAAGLYGFYHFFNPTSGGTDFENGLSIGYAVAILSAALVLSSFVRPAGPGCDDAESRHRLRYKTFHLLPRRDGQDSQSLREPRSHGQGRGGRNMQWFVMFATAISIILLALAASFATHEPREQLVEVNGGVMLVLGQNGMVIPRGCWNGSQLSLADGDAEVSWVLQNESWEQGPEGGWNSVSFETMNLSGVLVTPTVVDWTVPGYLSPGDLLVLAAESATQPYKSFTEGTEYTLMLNMSWVLKWVLVEVISFDSVRYPGVCYPISYGYEVSFEFNDGDMSYECHSLNSQGDPVDFEQRRDYAAVVVIAVVSMAVVAVSWYVSYAQAAHGHRKAR
jgi:hypothetical protein